MAADEDDNDGGFVAVKCAWSRLGCAPALRERVDDVLKRVHYVAVRGNGPPGGTSAPRTRRSHCWWPSATDEPAAQDSAIARRRRGGCGTTWRGSTAPTCA